MTKHNPRSNGHENGKENGSAEIEEAIPVKAGFLVVGIGASAGGVQALREFFANVPPDSGIAYVVILHLSPDFDSQLTEVLQQTTGMPVLQVTERARVEPNHIYVVSPDMHLSMSENYVEASKNVDTADRRAPVDISFARSRSRTGRGPSRWYCPARGRTGRWGSKG
jgi:chemotaxis response regulator CheB